MYLLCHRVVIVISLLTSLRCARILAVFPAPAISHQIVFRPITQELARRGHEVVVITPNPAFSGLLQAPDNFTEIDIGNASYTIWDQVVFKDKTTKTRDVVTDTTYLAKILNKVFEAAMQTQAIMDIIKKKEHYDLLLIEQGIELSLGFSHIFKAPVIQISSLGNLFFKDNHIGFEKHPFVYPHPMSHRVYNLTKFEKVQTIWNGLKLISVFELMNKEMNEIIKRIFGPDTPPLRELKDNIHMTMLNVHHVWIDNQPLSPNVILIGGIHENPPIPLPQDLQTQLDSSKNGTIYVSFGSKVKLSNFATETVQTLLEVLCNLPFDVLLKWDQAILPAECRNIKVSNWFPQADVLRHPKVKLFITQGGLQSTDEAISGGVPLIGIPIMGDQYYNSEKYVRHGIGKILDWNDFEAKTFRDAIEGVINDISYYDNIVRLRALMRDSPQTPLDRAVWWVEYVLRHGGARQLHPPTANMTLYEFLEIDLVIWIILSLLILILFVAISSYILVKFIKSNMLGRKKQKLY